MIRLRWLVGLLLALALPACGPVTFVVGVSPGERDLVATTVLSDGGLRSPRIALIDISGVLVNAEQPRLLEQGENPVALIQEQLATAGHDPRVEAVILRLNTPGGTVTASDAVYREVRRFREATGKPVIALMMDVAASGGYYVACAADEIIVHPTTVTGSIGVIVQTVSLKPALARWGIETEAFTSGPNKVAGSPLSTLTDDHRAVLQAMVDDFYEQFVDVVRLARPGLTEAGLARVADGRVVTGRDAVATGLADQLGDLYSAFEHAKSLANIEVADLVRYHRRLTHVGSPYAQAPGHAGGTPTTQVNLNFNHLGLVTTPGIYYLWRPDL
ncbi:MAG: signal peptide peptidase SppA [Phycisphaeraceae bacterium]